MAFPDSDLRVRIYAYMGADPNASPSGWPLPVELTGRLLDREISVSLGRRQGQRTAAAGQCSFWLDNHDGALTPGVPTSPYYGRWDLGVPVALDVDGVGTSPPYGLMRGYVAEIRPEIIPTASGPTSAVKVTLAGVLRRLGQGAVVKSAMRRNITRVNPTAAPRAYWPLERESGLSNVATATLPGVLVEPLSLSEAPSSPTGSDGAVRLTSPGSIVGEAEIYKGVLRLFVDSYIPSTDLVTIGLVMRQAREELPHFDAGRAPMSGTIAVSVTGTVGGLFFTWRSDPDEQVGVSAVEFGNGLGSGAFATGVDLGDGFWHHVKLVAQDASPNVNCWIYVDGVLTASGAIPSVSLGAIKELHDFGASYFDPEALVNKPWHMDICQIAVFDTFSSTGAVYPPPAAVDGYAGETASARFARVCVEEGIPHTPWSPAPSHDIRLGPQPVGTVLDVLRDAELAGHGILYEDTSTWGLGYRPMESRYNQSPGLTVDLSTYRVTGSTGRDVLQPFVNDQRLRNEWTISRPGGSSVTVRDAAHQAKYGRYTDSATVNVQTDDDLLHEAGWRLHETIYDGLRYAAMPIDLGANPSLIGDWLALRPGDRIDRTGHPSQHPAETVPVILEGYSMTLRRRSWTVDAIVEPYLPWHVGVYADEDDDADDDPERYDTAGCETLAGLWCPGTSGAYASTPDTAALDITGDLDLRASITPEDWAPSTNQAIISKYDANGDNRSYKLRFDSSGYLRLDVDPDGTGAFTRVYTANARVQPPRTGRLSVRVTLDVDTGSGQSVATFYTSEDQDLSSASWTQLGDPQTSTVATIFASSAALEVGSRDGGTRELFAGVIHAVQVRSGIGGTVVADVNFDTAATGDVSIVDDAGLTWTVHGDARIHHDFEAGTDTKLLVVTTLGPAWTTNPNDLPMRLRCAGVVLTVSAVEGSGQPQVLTITAADAEKTITPGASISLARPSVYAL